MNTISKMFLHALLLSAICSVNAHGTQPNIILIVADDLGWNDVSFHGSDQIPTPNIDKLAYEGVILFNYYVQHICTPTRSALLTGRHPIHTGLFHNTIGAASPYGLRPNETTIAEYLRPLGYSNHMVGKWHLGHFAEEYLPIRRGFDTTVGYYLGKEDYFEHTSDIVVDKHLLWGFDFHENGEVYKPVFGQYSTELFTERAESVINNHVNSTKPLFLYLPYQSVHSGNPDQPLQAPQKYIDRFPDIKDKDRTMFAAMVSALDDGVGNITRALKSAGLYENSVIIFTTDNGGPVNGFDGNCASNEPLRGSKHTLWEGGVRGVGFVNSPLLEKPGRVSEELIHVCDWMPTIYHLAGGDERKLKNLYGINQWDTVSRGKASQRFEILHNIDTVGNYSALRVGDYKLVVNSYKTDNWNDWYPTKGQQKVNPDPRATVVKCPSKPANASSNCQPFKAPCLFNIKLDPCEFNNIADIYPDIASELKARLAEILPTVVPAGNKKGDKNADPKLHGGNWVPWIKLEETNYL